MSFYIPAPEERPSFGSQLANVLTQAGADIGNGLVKGGSERKDRELLNSINEQSSPTQIAHVLGRLSPERAKQVSPVYEQIVKQHGETAKAKAAGEEKLRAEAAEKEAEIQQAKPLFDILDKYNEFTGPHRFGFANSENMGGVDPREVFSEYDLAGLILADKAYTAINKGPVSDVKLKEIILKQMAPNSSFTPQVNNGRRNVLKKVYMIPEETSSQKANAIAKKAVDEQLRLEEKERGPARSGYTWMQKEGQWAEIPDVNVKKAEEDFGYSIK